MQCSIQLYEELHGPCYMYGYGSLTTRAIYSGGIIIIDAQPMKLATATRTRRGAGYQYSTVLYITLPSFFRFPFFDNSSLPTLGDLQANKSGQRSSHSCYSCLLPLLSIYYPLHPLHHHEARSIPTWPSLYLSYPFPLLLSVLHLPLPYRSMCFYIDCTALHDIFLRVERERERKI